MSANIYIINIYILRNLANSIMHKVSENIKSKLVSNKIPLFVFGVFYIWTYKLIFLAIYQ